MGCDAAGHSYRPYSAKYHDDVKYVDSENSKLVVKVSEVFGDNDTAFIFTADPGLSAFGFHDNSHPNNTRTPSVAWSALLNKPRKNDVPIFDNYTKSWELGHVVRNDVKQADFASLMSYLIGVNYPVNPIGESPLSYIDGNESDKLNALYNNARAILEQYLVKREEVRNSQFVFKDYHKFVQKPFEVHLRKIYPVIDQIADGENNLEEQAISMIKNLTLTILEALHYLTTYNWRLIRTIVTLGFFVWIIYSFSMSLKLFIIPSNEYLKKESYY